MSDSSDIPDCGVSSDQDAGKIVYLAEIRARKQEGDYSVKADNLRVSISAKLELDDDEDLGPLCERLFEVSPDDDMAYAGRAYCFYRMAMMHLDNRSFKGYLFMNNRTGADMLLGLAYKNVLDALASDPVNYYATLLRFRLIPMLGIERFQEVDIGRFVYDSLESFPDDPEIRAYAAALYLKRFGDTETAMEIAEPLSEDPLLFEETIELFERIALERIQNR